MPVDTVLRRASVVGLLTLATAGLAACGDDGEENAQVGSTPTQAAATTPAETTPASTPATTAKPKKSDDGSLAEDDGGKAPGGATYVKIGAKDAAKITDKLETKETIAKESATAIPPATVEKQIEAAREALSIGGQGIEEREAGEAGSYGTILKANNATVMFFTSDRAAAAAARNYQQLAHTNPGFGRADHKGSRMWVLAVRTKWTKDDLERFRALRDRVEAAIEQV